MAEGVQRESSTVWKGVKLAFGGCIVLPILLGLVISFLIMLAAALNH